jgi:hypothetical protein
VGNDGAEDGAGGAAATARLGAFTGRFAAAVIGCRMMGGLVSPLG